MELEIDQLSIVDFNITEISIKDLRIDESKKLMLLGDNSAELSIKDLSGGIHAKYSYVSDPRIFEDAGEFDFNIKSASFTANGTTLIDES